MLPTDATSAIPAYPSLTSRAIVAPVVLRPDSRQTRVSYSPALYTDGSHSRQHSVNSIFRTQETTHSTHASVISIDASPHWRRNPIISLCITNIEQIGGISSYSPELLALTVAIWLHKSGGLTTPIHSDSAASLETIANRKRHLKSAKSSCHVLLRRISECLHRRSCLLQHVHSHADKDKDLDQLTSHEWGNFIADKIASGEYSSLAELHLTVIPLEINAVDILRDIPVTGSWYWGNET